MFRLHLDGVIKKPTVYLDGKVFDEGWKTAGLIINSTLL